MNNKKKLGIFGGAVAALALTGCVAYTVSGASPAQLFDAGTFTGVGAGGFGGDITVEATFDANSILDINITDHNETPAFAGMAIEGTINAILASQSTNVDTIAGATMTSQAIINAVNDAITQAGVDPTALVGQDVYIVTDVTTEADVVVVGAGLSGLVAAIHAAQNGASVVVIEKLGIPGGSSAFAWGGIAASETLFHERMDEMPAGATNAEFMAALLAQGASLHHDTGYPIVERVEQFVNNSHLRIQWMYDLGHTFGVSGRSHGVPAGAPTGDGAGTHHINFLVSTLDELGVPIYFNTRGTELVQENGVVTGVVASTAGGYITLTANEAVILATGGFSHNEELMARFVPQAAEFVRFSDAASGSHGDGIIMAEAVGAVPWPNQWVLGFGLVTESGAHGPFPRLLFGPNDPVLVNQDGNRFVNEEGFFSILSNAVMEYAPGGAFKIFDSSARFTQRGAGGSVNWPAIAQENLESGYVFKADTIAELAELIDVPVANLRATLNEVGAVALGNMVDPFGRSAANSTTFAQGPFFAVHYFTQDIGTFGGVITDMEYRVLDESGDVIPGLFAVGEMSNRPYWNQIYVAGTALSQAVGSGAIAGTVATGAPSPVID